MAAFEITASAAVLNVISNEMPHKSIGQSLPQLVIPRALGVNKQVAYSPGSITSTIAGSFVLPETIWAQLLSTLDLTRQFDGASNSVNK